jgi:hypothetical protein
LAEAAAGAGHDRYAAAEIEELVRHRSAVMEVRS